MKIMFKNTNDVDDFKSNCHKLLVSVLSIKKTTKNSLDKLTKGQTWNTILKLSQWLKYIFTVLVSYEVKERKIHWKKWSKLCTSKLKGVLAFRTFMLLIRPYWLNKGGCFYITPIPYFIGSLMPGLKCLSCYILGHNPSSYMA